MWTPTTRRQQSRDELRYSTDLTDAEWDVIPLSTPGLPTSPQPQAWHGAPRPTPTNRERESARPSPPPATKAKLSVTPYPATSGPRPNPAQRLCLLLGSPVLR